MTIPAAQPGKTRIGWIGTGVMGRWMCQHAIDEGLQGHRLQPQQGQGCKPLLDLGREGGRQRRRQVAEQSDVVFAIVGFPKDVREVFLGTDGALAGSKAGQRARGHDHQRADAGAGDLRRREGQGRLRRSMPPVSGGDVGAKNAALSIMIGGDKDVVAAVQPLFECMGKTIVHQGAAGAGQHTKMVNQILISSNMIARLRGAALRLQGRPRPGNGVQVASASGRRAARRSRSSGRG